MLVLVDLFEFKVIVTPELGVASSHRVGSFQQVVAEIAVAGFNHSGVLRFKFTGLVLCPDKAGKLGDIQVEPRIIPVSYTHLDVYKRQAKERTANLLR